MVVAATLRRKIKQAMAGFDFQEIMTYTLISNDIMRKIYSEPHDPDPPPAKVANPMTVDQEYLRPSLRPNLLAALAANTWWLSGGRGNPNTGLALSNVI
jgi:phenylalanyl-tRNA synthetase beta subunit